MYGRFEHNGRWNDINNGHRAPAVYKRVAPEPVEAVGQRMEGR
jgi:hypothetical protein